MVSCLRLLCNNSEKSFYIHFFTFGSVNEKMVETENKPRKVVGRTVAIVLIIVCVVLSTGLIAAVAVYLPTASTIDRLNSENAGLNGNVTVLTQQIANLQNTLTQRENTISNTNYTISSLNAEINALNDEINGLLNVLYMNASETPISNQEFSVFPSENSTIWSGTINYAGYFTVSVESSSNTTFVQLAYYSYGINFDQTMLVGTSGIVGFPVLPADNINVILGNAELVDSVNGTVSVNYYY
jgi:cell division protein FtsB